MYELTTPEPEARTPVAPTGQLSRDDRREQAAGMLIPRVPHRWSVTPRQAIVIQRRLAFLVKSAGSRRPLRLVAGLDAAFSRDDRRCLAAVVLWDVGRRAIVEQHLVVRRLTFPYIPGMLSFREAPALIAALRKLGTVPDALVCDGHGLAHPRRFGIACHIGIITDLPTLGCAKSRLTGHYMPPGGKRGARAPLTEAGRIVGSVLRTQDAIKPVFVSIGHKIDLRTAERLVLACATRHRLPEPTRLADLLASAAKREGL